MGMQNTLFLDCEFDGAFGELISIALVPWNYDPVKYPDATAFYAVTQHMPQNEWVKEHVVPALMVVEQSPIEVIQRELADYLTDYHEDLLFVCDHPADIMYLSTLLILRHDPANTIQMPEKYQFEVAYTEGMQKAGNVSEVPHNALCDAQALRLNYMTDWMNG